MRIEETLKKVRARKMNIKEIRKQREIKNKLAEKALRRLAFRY